MTTAHVQSQSSKLEVAQAILRSGTATRQEISAIVRLSPARVTTHTRWLLENDFLRTEMLRLPHAHRPVEQLSLNPDNGTGLGLMVTAKQVRADIVSLDASSLASRDFVVVGATGSQVANAANEAVHWARQTVAGLNRSFDSVCCVVDGQVGVHTGLVVYSVDGVENWPACDLQKVLEGFQSFEPHDTKRFWAWPMIMCKTRGYAESARKYHRIGYFEFDGRQLRYGKLDHGTINRGYLGIDGGVLHTNIHSAGPLCFCGRRGCLADALGRGDRIDPEVLVSHLVKVAKRERIKHLGLDWSAESEPLRFALLEAGLSQVDWVNDSAPLAQRGLCSLAAEAAAHAVIEARHHADAVSM